MIRFINTEDVLLRIGDILRLKSSYGLDPILDGFAFSTETLYQRYRDPEHVPPRIRARLYLVTWRSTWSAVVSF